MDDLWATKSEDVGLTVRAVSFQDFQPMWSWSTNVTDRQTDRRRDDMRSQDRALHYSASRGKTSRFRVTVVIAHIAAAGANLSIVFARWRPVHGTHPSNTWFLGPTRVCSSPNNILIVSVVFARLTVVTNKQTDCMATGHATSCKICSNMPHLP